MGVGGGSVSWGPELRPGALSRIQMVAPVPPRIISLMGNHTCGPLSWMFMQLWVGTVLAALLVQRTAQTIHPQELELKSIGCTRRDRMGQTTDIHLEAFHKQPGAEKASHGMM